MINNLLKMFYMRMHPVSLSEWRKKKRKVTEAMTFCKNLVFWWGKNNQVGKSLRIFQSFSRK